MPAEVDVRRYASLVDRKKAVILVSGFKVWPAEVEEVLLAIPDVKEAGVAGMPDEKSDEAVWACVVKSHPALTEQQIIDARHAQLAHYNKTPRQAALRTRIRAGGQADRDGPTVIPPQPPPHVQRKEPSCLMRPARTSASPPVRSPPRPATAWPFCAAF